MASGEIHGKEDNPTYLKWASRLNAERAGVLVKKGKSPKLPTDPARLREAARRHRQMEPNVALFGLNNTALGAALEFYRMGRCQIPPALERRAAELGMRFEHLGVTIGTVIHGVDLRQDLSEEVIDVIKKTQLERKVVFFRDQHITVDQQLAFARRFGPLDAFPFGDHATDSPFVLRIAGIGAAGANRWHTDVTWMERPSKGSILHMVEAPAVGGDTLFSDSHAAYLGLSERVRAALVGVRGVNDYRGFLEQQRQQGLSEATIEELKREVPFGVAHPLVRTHPETGKQALFLNGGFLRHDSLHDDSGPWGAEKSRKMVWHLEQQHAKGEYQCRFKYEAGSMAFWDNAACQHCASTDYYPYARVGHRVTLSGDRPYFDPNAVPMTHPVEPQAKL